MKWYVGIDPSYRRCGIAIVSDEKGQLALEVLSSVSVEFPKHQTVFNCSLAADQLACELSEKLRRFIMDRGVLQFDFLIEEPSFRGVLAPAMNVLYGMVLSAIKELHIEVRVSIKTLTPLSIQTLFGRRSSKTASVDLAKELLKINNMNLTNQRMNHDEAEALIYAFLCLPACKWPSFISQARRLSVQKTGDAHVFYREL